MHLRMNNSTSIHQSWVKIVDLLHDQVYPKHFAAYQAKTIIQATIGLVGANQEVGA